MDRETKSHLHETPAVVTVPLVLLAIPSAVIGWIAIEPVLFGGFFGESIQVLQRHDVLAELGTAFHGSAQFIVHALQGPAVYLATAGVVMAWYLYLHRPDLPEKIRQRFSGVYSLLDRKYYFDDLYIKGFAAGGRSAGRFLWQQGDELVIDGMMVNGTARSVGRLAAVLRQLQTGYLYHYAFAMIIALSAVLFWLLWLN
jgi:NADH-quinone oxidoreductase subunit L